MIASVAASANLWRVAVITDTFILPAEQRAELLAWIGGLGVDVDSVRPCLAVSQDGGDRSYRLHLSRFAVDERGDKVVDYALGQVHSEPLVIPIDADSWPQWLPQAGHEQATKEQDGAG